MGHKNQMKLYDVNVCAELFQICLSFQLFLHTQPILLDMASHYMDSSKASLGLYFELFYQLNAQIHTFRLRFKDLHMI